MSTMVKTIEKPRLSIKVQAFATLAAVVGAVALPQLFHALGAASGLGTALGETFLPMHLPILFVGLLAGPYAGAVAGLCGPLVSFALSGMPGAVMLPFMMVELCAYGLFSGLLRNVKLPVFAKVLVVQILGRALRAAAVLIAVYALGNEALGVSSIRASLITGLPGIVLQWALLPLLTFRVEHMKKNEQ